ncbi:MAG: hypothetical protein WB789_04880 [Thermoplasmata archaeon]
MPAPLLMEALLLLVGGVLSAASLLFGFHTYYVNFWAPGLVAIAIWILVARFGETATGGVLVFLISWGIGLVLVNGWFGA